MSDLGSHAASFKVDARLFVQTKKDLKSFTFELISSNDLNKKNCSDKNISNILKNEFSVIYETM